MYENRSLCKIKQLTIVLNLEKWQAALFNRSCGKSRFLNGMFSLKTLFIFSVVNNSNSDSIHSNKYTQKKLYYENILNALEHNRPRTKPRINFI